MNISTVSRALNNRPGVNSDTKEKILIVALELKYTPDIFATKLAGGKVKQIGVLIPEISGNYFAQVFECIERAFKECGVELNPNNIRDGMELFEDGGYLRMKELLQCSKIPTAVFTGNDYMAIGAIRAMSEVGLKVPDDISLVGYDDIREAQYLPCSLSTFSMPIEEMVEFSKDLLFQKVNKKKLNAIQHIMLPSTFIARDSIGKNKKNN